MKSYVCPSHKNVSSKQNEKHIDQRLKCFQWRSPFLLSGIEMKVCHSPENVAVESLNQVNVLYRKKTYPNQPSNSELIRLSISEKNGMTSAIIQANIHVAATIPTQVAQPTNVLECRCFELPKILKKMNRVVTDYQGQQRLKLEGWMYSQSKALQGKQS